MNSTSTNKTYCLDHSGNCEAIDNTKNDVNKIWIEIGKVKLSIEGIKNWIIAGMGSLVLQGAIALIKYFTASGGFK